MSAVSYRQKYSSLLITWRQVARLYIKCRSIQPRRNNSRFIQGKCGNFISFSNIFSKALSRNITSWDNAISVIAVVFFLPIVPQTIYTIGRAFIKPRFFISLWFRTRIAIDLRTISKTTTPKITHDHQGAKPNIADKSIASLYTCRYRLFISKDMTKYK